MRARWVALALAGCVLGLSQPGIAKDYGVHSPTGRQIYDEDEELGHVADTQLRRLVVEAVLGSGPEGNIGALVGWRELPVPRLAIYAGFGLELNPARRYTGALRYTFNFSGYRPYVGAGYVFNDLYRLGTFTHDVFAETGYVWVIRRTYRLTLGVGVRYQAYLGINDDSPLRGAEVDQNLLAEQRADVFPWVPTLALRFSRAF